MGVKQHQSTADEADKIAGVSAEAVEQGMEKHRGLSLENSDKSDLQFIWVSSRVHQNTLILVIDLSGS